MNDKATYIPLKDILITVPGTLLFHDVGDEIVLLNVETGDYYGLNKMGSRIWTMVQEGQSIDGIHANLFDEYEVSSQRLEQDIQEFLALLQSKSIIEINERPSK